MRFNLLFLNLIVRNSAFGSIITITRVIINNTLKVIHQVLIIIK